ncbi:hypothetical protein ACTGW1_09765 [Streptococcus suis]
MEKTKKFTKTDLQQDFSNVVFKTIDPTKMQQYSLDEVSKEIIDKFINFISKVNESESWFTYYRGTRFEKIDSDADCVLKHGLNKFFIVGEKGVTYMDNQQSKASMTELESQYQNEEELLEIIRASDIKLEEFFLPTESSLRIKILQAILHISGKEIFPNFKSFMSQFISTAVGTNNFNIAKNFIGDKGFIIFGFEKIGNYFINSEQLRYPLIDSEISRCLIDTEQEVMIEEVLWPSNIFGLFYINGTEKIFIINPWLVEKMKTEEEFENPLIYVNQENFNNIFKDLGYGDYAYRPY